MVMAVALSLAFLVSVLEVSSGIVDYDFTQWCNHGNTNKSLKIPTKDGQMLLSYYSSKPLPINTECTVFVYNPATSKYKTYKPRVLAYFIKFHGNCGTSRMDIFNGQGTDNGTALTGKNGTCGSWSGGKYNSTQKYMTFKFKDTKNASYSNFKILITAVHNGSCRRNEFRCGTGFCIRDSLVCNGFNNCGNNADELACSFVVALTVGAITAIVLAVLVVVVCIPVVIVCLVCRPQRRRMYRQI